MLLELFSDAAPASVDLDICAKVSERIPIRRGSQKDFFCSLFSVKIVPRIARGKELVDVLGERDVSRQVVARYMDSFFK